MRKLFILFIVFLLAVSLCGCTTTEIHGIENFYSMQSSMDLNCYLLPGNEAFLTKYPYISGEYHFYEYDRILHTKLTSFVNLTYPVSVYEDAKEHCLQSFAFTDRQYLHDGFTFIEHIVDDTFDFPEQMRIFAFNDATQQLMFFVYFNTDMTDESKQLALNNFGEFFNQEFQTRRTAPASLS